MEASLLFIQFQDEDILDQIFGTEPETHISVTCPDCGSLVSCSSDLEFHNCSGGRLLVLSKNIAQKTTKACKNTQESPKKLENSELATPFYNMR